MEYGVLVVVVPPGLSSVSPEGAVPTVFADEIDAQKWIAFAAAVGVTAVADDVYPLLCAAAVIACLSTGVVVLTPDHSVNPATHSLAAVIEKGGDATSDDVATYVPTFVNEPIVPESTSVKFAGAVIDPVVCVRMHATCTSPAVAASPVAGTTEVEELFLLNEDDTSAIAASTGIGSIVKTPRNGRSRSHFIACSFRPYSSP
jgi:hypothetical protein